MRIDGRRACTVLFVTNLLFLAAPFTGFTTAVLSARRRRRRLSGTLTAALFFAESANGASYA